MLCRCSMAAALLFSASCIQLRAALARAGREPADIVHRPTQQRRLLGSSLQATNSALATFARLTCTTRGQPCQWWQEAMCNRQCRLLRADEAGRGGQSAVRNAVCCGPRMASARVEDGEVIQPLYLRTKSVVTTTARGVQPTSCRSRP